MPPPPKDKDIEYVANRYDHIITHSIWGLKELGFVTRETEIKIRDLLKEDFKNAKHKRTD